MLTKLTNNHLSLFFSSNSQKVPLSCRLFGWSGSWGYITDTLYFLLWKRNHFQEWQLPRLQDLKKNISSDIFLNRCFYISVLLYHFWLAAVSSLFSSKEYIHYLPFTSSNLQAWWLPGLSDSSSTNILLWTKGASFQPNNRGQIFSPIFY